MSGSEIRRIFEPFERPGAGLTDTPGTGIGLTIARQVAEAMHGSVEVHSEPGHGSTFSVTLPRA